MKKNTCDDCMFDKTDVCSGRTDGHICSDFLRECKKCPEYDTVNGNCPLYCKFIRDNLSEAIIFELEEIKSEMDKYKEFQDGHFIEASDMKYSLMYVIDEHILALKGENDEKEN